MGERTTQRKYLLPQQNNNNKKAPVDLACWGARAHEHSIYQLVYTYATTAGPVRPVRPNTGNASSFIFNILVCKYRAEHIMRPLHIKQTAGPAADAAATNCAIFIPTPA